MVCGISPQLWGLACSEPSVRSTAESSPVPCRSVIPSAGETRPLGSGREATACHSRCQPYPIHGARNAASTMVVMVDLAAMVGVVDMVQRLSGPSPAPHCVPYLPSHDARWLLQSRNPKTTAVGTQTRAKDSESASPRGDPPI